MLPAEGVARTGIKQCGRVAMSWNVYRPGEGRWARLSAMVAIVVMGSFSAYRWHLWASERGLMRWLPRIGSHQLTWAEVGAALLMVVSALIGYRICFARPGTSDFMIETEIELRKVTWPEWKPVFRAKTELWGSAYVVMLVIAALGFFVFVVDLALRSASGAIFFR